MPAERLSMRKVREVLRPKYACGASVRTIARSVAVGHTTVAEYLRRPTVIGIIWPVPSEIDDTKLERRLFAPAGFYTAPTRAMPDWNHVHAGLRRRGVTLLLSWEDAAVTAEQHVGMDKRSSAAAALCRIRSGAATAAPQRQDGEWFTQSTVRPPRTGSVPPGTQVRKWLRDTEPRRPSVPGTATMGGKPTFVRRARSFSVIRHRPRPLRGSDWTGKGATELAAI